MEIENRTITYVCIPTFLLIGGRGSKDFFVDAMRLVHRPSRRIMIFVSKKEIRNQWFRYTLLHEHMEAMFELNIDNFVKDHTQKTKELVSMIKDRLPHIIDNLKKSKQDESHMFALIFEIDLAMREMNETKLEIFLADIIKNRL